MAQGWLRAADEMPPTRWDLPDLALYRTGMAVIMFAPRAADDLGGNDMHRFASFREFYPFYLSEHRHPISRRLHFIGSCGVLALLGIALWQRSGAWLLAAMVCGYGFAWVGHFFFEKNRPATFKYPFYSFAGDWVMFKDILLGRIRF